MKAVGKTCLEILAICVAAFVLGIAGNAINANGISLGRDYLRMGVKEPPPDPGVTVPAEGHSSAAQPPPISSRAPSADHQHGEVCDEDQVPDKASNNQWRLDEETGLQMAGFEFTFHHHAAMADNPDFIVFVDARDEEAYVEEHIAGALLVDYWKLGRYLPAVLPKLKSAGLIFIYCAGGDCEDSRFLASALINEHGLSLDSIYVYEGGIEEWIAKGKPRREGLQP